VGLVFCDISDDLLDRDTVKVALIHDNQSNLAAAIAEFCKSSQEQVDALVPKRSTDIDKYRLVLADGKIGSVDLAFIAAQGAENGSDAPEACTSMLLDELDILTASFSGQLLMVNGSALVALAYGAFAANARWCDAKDALSIGVPRVKHVRQQISCTAPKQPRSTKFR
jgi:hypothetical protein